MWRGPVIQQKKEAAANARGKIYAIHSKLITLAAQSGAEVDLNPSLANAIATAKKASVPNDIIDRAIKRGSWLDKSESEIETVLYEGYAPGGVGVIVRALTDNRNRTAPNIRHIFWAYGGNLGETGSVSNYTFSYDGVIRVDLTGKSADGFEEAILETEASDYTLEETEAIVIVEKNYLHPVTQFLEKKGFPIISSGLEYRPKNYTEVTDFDKALKIYKMLAEFEEDEDVEKVWNNADIQDTLWKEVEDFIESKTFRT